MSTEGPTSSESSEDDTLQRAPTTPASRAKPDWSSIEVPNYELLGLLGRGGMGVVYKARHLNLGRVVAAQDDPRRRAHADKDQLKRFQIEAEAVARLQHPNIVQIFDVGDYKGQPYFALEFIGGGSLQQRIVQAPLAGRKAAEIMVALARAVDYAHQRGIVHRDLKPANILLEGSGPRSGASQRLTPDPFPLTPKITDFGLAKRLEDDSQTGTGEVLGTPSYMAPEQARGKGKIVGPSADVYALGAILYDTLTGRPPFKGETVLDTLQQVAARDPCRRKDCSRKFPPIWKPSA